MDATGLPLLNVALTHGHAYLSRLTLRAAEDKYYLLGDSIRGT